MIKSGGNFWIAVLFILAGVVIGGFIGTYLGGIPVLSWLNYGANFGITNPLTLDLGVLVLQFGLSIRFTIAGIIGMLIAIFAYKKF